MRDIDLLKELAVKKGYVIKDISNADKNIVVNEVEKIQRQTALLALGYLVNDKEDWLLECPKEVFIRELEFLAYMRGYDRDWGRTLFEKYMLEEYTLETLLILIRNLKTLIHYFTTYGAEALGIEVPLYFPNNQENTVVKGEELFRKLIDKNIPYKFTKLTSKTLEEVREIIYNNLLKTNTPLTRKELAFMEEEFSVRDVNLDDIKFLELKVLALDRAKEIKNIKPLDVIRWSIYKALGTPLVLNSKKLRILKEMSIETYTYMKFWDLLSKCNEEELKKAYRQKRKVFNIVFNYNKFKEMRKEYPNKPIIKLCRKLKNRNAKGIVSDYGKFERNLEKGIIVDPNKFVEYFSRIWIKYPNKIVELLNKFKSELSNKHLIRLYNFIVAKEKEEDFRMFILPHAVWEEEGENIFKGDITLKDTLSDILRKEILRRIRERTKDMKIFISDNVNKQMKVPLTARKGIEVGSYIDIKELVKDLDNKILRIGVHWYDSKDYRVDIDLSAYLYRDGMKDIISWSYRSMNELANFSGDVTSALRPRGGAEFIDIDLDLVRCLDIDILFNLYLFHGRLDEPAVIGVQIVDKENKDIEFNPSKLIYLHKEDFNEGHKIFTGILSVEDGDIRYFPMSLSQGTGLGSRMKLDDNVENILKRITDKAARKLSVNDFIEVLNIVDEMDEDVIVIQDDNEMINFVKQILEL